MPWVHRLSNKDVENQQAICAADGLVKIRWNGENWQCNVAVLSAQRARRRRNRQYPDTCEVCGSTKRICYDHDHATGKHRGYLCDRCNRILGAAKDDVTILRGLADYLEK